MPDSDKVCKPLDGQSYLAEFDRKTRRQGEQCFFQGRVSHLVCFEPGVSYQATVSGSPCFTVTLEYEAGSGWRGTCTCPAELDCQHAYAAMRALWSGKRAVQQQVEKSKKSIKSTNKSSKANATQTQPPPPVRPENRFEAVVTAKLGRALKSDELDYLDNLERTYVESSSSSVLTGWGLIRLGCARGIQSWDTFVPWPVFPRDPLVFWNYVALVIRQRGFDLPTFLLPITDLKLIEAEIAQKQRHETVVQWKQRLKLAAPLFQPEPPAVVVTAYDLRLRLLEKSVILERKAKGSETFETMPDNARREFDLRFKRGEIELSSEAELLWQAVSQNYLYDAIFRLDYGNHEFVQVLNRLLRSRKMETLVVNAQGLPFIRAAEPLRWDLLSATGPDDDYQLRLIKSDGTSPGPIWFCLEGHPPLYVTREVIYRGPGSCRAILIHGGENRIPAPAIENVEGLDFLQRLGLALPPRLQEMIWVIPLRLVVYCKLQPIFPESRTEDCVFNVMAEAEDGSVCERWNGSGWHLERAPQSAPNSIGGKIPIYDRSQMDGVGSLFASPPFKIPAHDGPLSLRVTKEFPMLFTEWLRSVPSHVTVKLAGDLASLANLPVSGRIRLEAVESEIDWFDLRVVLDVTDTELTPEEIKALLDAKGGYVRLARKGWRRLAYDLTPEQDEQLARLGLNPHELTSEPQRLHALQLADESAKQFLPEPQVQAIQRRAAEIIARVTPEIPAGVMAEMRPYQREGFHFLAYLAANHFGGILADDMGLGKTLQALVWLLWLRAVQTEPSRPTLVVCPKSVMDNWRAEAERFTPGLRVKQWRASDLDQFGAGLAEADVHVINYSQLRLLGEGLVTTGWLAIILDEGQYIKNPNSQTAQVARSLRAEHRLVLSGTPIENRLLDLWSLMAFAMPGMLGSRALFGRLYDAKNDGLARRRLASRVRPFLLRRTKLQVAKDLPDRIEEDLYCEIEGEQKTLYRAELKRAQQILLKVKTAKQLAKERFNFLTSLLRLRQICCHPALVNSGFKAESAKVEALLEQLEPIMEEGNKVLVFSQFVQMLDLLKPILEQREWPLFYLAGDTENRGELVQRFQSAEGSAVFLISLKAGGFGLNLTAASYVILFDPWWNPAVENQAIDRTHRIGQTSKVMAYRLLIKDSIEEKIRSLQKQKSALAEDILGEEKFAQNLTLEDLRFLLVD